jgi:hypothetical protein
MRIDTQIKLKDLGGKEIVTSDTKEPMSFGKALANIVISGQEGGKMKLYTLAKQLFNDKAVEVTKAELDMIIRITETSAAYNSLIVGQCQLLLDEVK